MDQYCKREGRSKSIIVSSIAFFKRDALGLGRKVGIEGGTSDRVPVLTRIKVELELDQRNDKMSNGIGIGTNCVPLRAAPGT